MTRIVILGGGFGGTEAMRRLERQLGGRSDVELLLVSDTNYLLSRRCCPGRLLARRASPHHPAHPRRPGKPAFPVPP